MLRKLLFQQASTARRLLSAQSIAPLLNKCSVCSYSSSSRSEIPQTNSIEQIEDQPTKTISIDRSGLYNPPGNFLSFSLSMFLSFNFFSYFLFFFCGCVLEHSHEPSSDSELVKHLKGIIKVSKIGPL